MAILDVVKVALTWVGTAFLVYYATRLALFVQLHFVHQSTLHRYRKAKGRPEESAWALVTGSTDGIGKGFAEELCERGFNVIIHGRNQHKLESVKTDLNKRWPNQQVQILKIDAGKDAADAEVLARAATNLKNFDLKVLVNNLGGNGGMGVSFMPLHERTSSQISAVMDINARIPTEITRALLQQLRENGTALIVNVGSTTSDFGLPYLSIYSGCKSYNKAWSRCLTAEMKAEGADVEVFCLLVSAAATNYVPRRSVVLRSSNTAPSPQAPSKCILCHLGQSFEPAWHTTTRPVPKRTTNCSQSPIQQADTR